MSSGFRTERDRKVETPEGKESFKSWLQSQPSGTTFKRDDCKNCPLAKFNQAEVGEYGCFRYDKDAPPNSVWLIEFARKVDSEPGETVTVDRCLEILETV